MSTPANQVDWNAQVLGGGDGGIYTAAHGANKNAILNLLRQFGSTSALAPSEAAAYGITPADEQGIDENPYSTVKQLAKTLVTNQYGITNNAAAHGAEFSGANAAQQQGELANAGQRNFDATQAFNTGTNTVDQNDANAYGTAIQTLMNNYVAPPPAAAAAAPVSAATPTPVTKPTTALNNPTAIGGGVPYHTPGAPLAKIAKPPAVPKPPGIGGMGHIT